MKTLFGILLLACGLWGQPRMAAVDPSVSNAANLPAQKIGANDLLVVAVYDSPELTRTVRVGPDGSIRLPMVKQRIAVLGLLPVDVETAVSQVLKDEQLIVDPFVTVTVAEYHSRPISVMGSVRKPVTFQAEAPVTLLNALARAEGLNPDAGQEILISRPSPGGSAEPPLVQRIPVKSLIDGADPAVNVMLSGGEEVRVPEGGRIYVVGNVKKPGAFPVLDTSETTVLKALALSEGLLPYTNKMAFIYRTEGGAGGKNEIPVELRKIMDRKAPDVALMPNDILYVTDNKGRRLSLTALEKVIIFGAGITSALVYAGVR